MTIMASKKDESGHIAVRAAILVVILMLGVASPCYAENEKSTLESGDYDDFLMVSADHDSGMLSGYYNDGKCRFAFRGPLVPTPLPQREDFGEAYQITSWEPSRPDRTFTTSFYSRARKGFSDQITLEPGERDPNRPAICRSRISLDRADEVGSDVVGVRVVRRAKAPVFGMKKIAGKMRLLQTGTHAPGPGKGLWVERTYSSDSSRRGFIYANWYDPPGTGHNGYLRESDLFPEPKVEP